MLIKIRKYSTKKLIKNSKIIKDFSIQFNPLFLYKSGWQKLMENSEYLFDTRIINLI